MKKIFWLLSIVLLLLSGADVVEARRRGGIFKHIGHAFKSVGHGIKKVFHTVARHASRIGRKILDMPPKHRSRFDTYPIYVIRYHQFIWHRHFGYYLNSIDDGRPKLPKTNCWSIKCWLKRNQFKHYWKSRAPIRLDGPNSSPFLHRRCRIPHMKGGRCISEHLRHDYYWRMFMWIGRYGFPIPPPRKRFCMTGACELKRMRYQRYWRNFWIYSSLIPILRPYDFNWRMWVWRYKGNFYRLQQITAPALQSMGFGWMVMGGMMGGGQLGLSRFMTFEAKNALLAVLQKTLSETAALANIAQNTLRNQGSMLFSIMHMPAYSSASAAQMQMQTMMQRMHGMQHYQQLQMQQTLASQMWQMAQYLRGSCGCSVCSGGGIHGMHTHGMVNGLTGSGMYVGGHGSYSSYNPAMAGMTGGALSLPGTVRTPMELKMRAQALYHRNNIPAYA